MASLVVVGVGVPGGPVPPLVPAEVRVRRRDLQRVASRSARLGWRGLWRCHSTQPMQHQMQANRPGPLRDAPSWGPPRVVDHARGVPVGTGRASGQRSMQPPDQVLERPGVFSYPTLSRIGRVSSG